jgi:hypothetical protein
VFVYRFDFLYTQFFLAAPTAAVPDKAVEEDVMPEKAVEKDVYDFIVIGTLST